MSKLFLLSLSILLGASNVIVRAIEQGRTIRRQVLSDGSQMQTETPPSRPKLYYTRDGAGFSNGRLMFESLVAIAAVTGRELVIPGRSTIEHMAHEKFHEFDVYSREALKKVINISELSPAIDYRDLDRPEEAKQAAILSKHLNEHDVRKDLPVDGDWCFLAKDARITHFECLQLNPEDQAKAAAAVFNGLQIKEHWIQEARKALVTLGLQAGEYVAVHLRRTDFEQANPTVVQDGSTVSAALNKYTDGKPLLILTDAPSTDKSVFVDIPSTSHASKVLFTATGLQHSKNQSLVHSLMVDVLLGSMAGQFIGTPLSTLTNTINLLRRKTSMCNQRSGSKSLVQGHTNGSNYAATDLYSKTYWFTDDVNFILHRDDVQYKVGELCFLKLTTFEHIRPSDVLVCEMTTS
eukprot:TRINITY_DN77521_c0_g1_i1.p1 TRINITY_DN77521_c0_g1~~TRINITY_DN77521_c0_g1_i1.p1  ORF type:complete len:407 (+),score=66.98 TRINITY_DN77521_c0_g1_i1:72-1292(+)